MKSAPYCLWHYIPGISYSLYDTPLSQYVRRQAHEPMGVQTLGSKLAIEALNVAVICRLARPGDVEHHSLW